MTDNELLLAISDIVGKNTKMLEKRIDRVENSVYKRIDEVEASLSTRIDEVEASLSTRIDEVEASLSTRIDEVEASLSTRIDEVDASLNNKIDEVDRRLSANVHNILLRMENVIEPRINHIEECYTSTYRRYQDGVDKIEKLEMNMDVVQSVVKEHAVKLSVLTA